MPRRATGLLTLLAITLATAALLTPRLGSANAATLQRRAVAPLISADTIPSSNLPTANIPLRDGTAATTLTVELATTPAQHARGLMFRTDLPDTEGMLFVFNGDQTGAFWMENTYIPLDIAYIDANGVVLGVVYGQPLDLTPLYPPSAYRYVLEVAGGWFERHNMAPGAIIELPATLLPPTR
ncbi:MAG: DUF192 domain-containing protein [Tepidiformaceae bacterium]